MNNGKVVETLINFKNIVELRIMIDFCKLFSSITGLVLDINDINGSHPKKYYPKKVENRFCKIIQRSEIGKERCLESGKKQGLNAAKFKKPQIQFCHAGLIDVYIPICIREKHIATLCTGQFLFNKPTENSFKDVLKRIEGIDVDISSIKRAYFNTKVISKNQLFNYIKLVNLIISYIFEVEDKIFYLKNNNINPIISKSLRYVEENYNKKILIEEVAKYTCVSKYYFEHIFKKEMGITFIEYLNYFRISRAKKMMLCSRDITSVCFDVGYNNLSHFYKNFKKFTGTTPKSYIESLRH